MSMEYTVDDMAILARYGSPIMVELAGDFADGLLMYNAAHNPGPTARSRNRWLASMGMIGLQREEFWIESSSNKPE